MRRRIATILLCLLGLPTVAALPAAADSVDDFQAWLGLNTIFWKKGPWNASVWTEARYKDDVSTALGYFVGPGIGYKPHPNWSFDFAIRYIIFAAEPDDLKLFRYQLAVTPGFRLGKRARFSLRNRVEWLRGDIDRTRVRHRADLRWSVRDMGLGRLSAIYVQEELFYDWDVWDINQSRFVPLGLVWDLGPHWNLSTYYMVHYVHPASENRHALGITGVWTPGR